MRPHFVAALLLAPAGIAAVLLSHAPAVQASSHADRDAGDALFHSKGCEHCHGPALLGTERGPALTGVGRKLKPPAIEHQIVAGGDGMPAFGEILAPDEMSHLVSFLAAQKKRPPPPSKSQPAPPPAPKPSSNGSDDQG